MSIHEEQSTYLSIFTPCKKFVVIICLIDTVGKVIIISKPSTFFFLTSH